MNRRQKALQKNKMLLLQNIEQQRLDIDDTYHNWQKSIQGIEHNLAPLLKTRKYILFGLGLCTIYGLRHPLSCIGLSKNIIKTWATGKLINKIFSTSHFAFLSDK